ncbi:GNAT family N-acetyltransferase [Chitinophaga nivalis]|uniref:GNAT family N-acetyltransferase n=1 Tax=Chitinophaga nivalis TaxID=2991709 RepID=A0ABT3IQF0_9BACT|nr:GNAT family N-acetyltransferase [Chitinophaga nivalis]MCW3464129.1 GNAT family N-acetyltransferase [Chitinophaga nivalis]MCW3486181.1 GNAT family N-acetyltransferase [Chitinophaga nivalis]
MILIKQLSGFSPAAFASFGHNGYTSDQAFEVTKKVAADEMTLCLKLIDLRIPYVKDWEEDEASFATYEQLIAEGHSFGAYDADQLVGVVICEARTWNNTLWIDLMMIAQSHRRKGIGALLLQQVSRHAVGKGFRLVGLETQHTNAPAIKFYQQQGFEITGLDLRLYEQENEVAFFMSKKLREN